MMTWTGTESQVITVKDVMLAVDACRNSWPLSNPVTALAESKEVNLNVVAAAFHRAWQAGYIAFSGIYSRSWVTSIGRAYLAGEM